MWSICRGDHEMCVDGCVMPINDIDRGTSSGVCVFVLVVSSVLVALSPKYSRRIYCDTFHRLLSFI